VPVPSGSAARPTGLALDLAAIGLVRTAPEGVRREILRTVDLRVAPGEQLAIVGASGAGKTSLLQIAAGALRADRGTVRFDEELFWDVTPQARQRMRRALFLAPQVPPLPPRQRVVTAVLAARLPTLGFWRGLASLFYPAHLPAVRAALAPFGLDARIFDRVDRLSGGERQRVGLARALVSPARIWLLDEPLAALDPVHADLVLGLLCSEARRRGVTLLICLHQAELARKHFARFVGLRAGSIAFDQQATTLTAAQWHALYEGESTQDARDAAQRAARDGVA
jgi:phosphonate transport system ATP-binding protein